MFKLISLPDNKGSVYSPFIIAALLLITFSVSAYLIEAQAARESGIASVGRIERMRMDMEEKRLEARMLAFRSLCGALSSGGNRTAAEIEESVAADMDARVRGIAGVSSVTGNYSFSLRNLSGGRLLLVSVAAPRACLVRSEAIVCADLSLEEVIDREWIS